MRLSLLLVAVPSVALGLLLGGLSAGGPPLAAPGPAFAQAQDPATMPEASISLAAANRMLDAAEQQARAMNVAVSLAIVDPSGRLKAFRRMDGTRPNSIQSAQDKAYTTILYASDTRDLWERAQNNAALLMTVSQQPHVDLTAGGQLIRVGDVVVGAIGVGGGRAGEDEPIAEAARAVLSR